MKSVSILLVLLGLSSCHGSESASKMADTLNTPGYDLTGRIYRGQSGECIEFLSNTEVAVVLSPSSESESTGRYTYTKDSRQPGLYLFPVGAGSIFTGIVPFWAIVGSARGWPEITYTEGFSQPGPNGSNKVIDVQVTLSRSSGSCDLSANGEIDPLP